MRLSELAERLGAELRGDGAAGITGVSAAASARPHELAFAENEGALASALRGHAGAILVPAGLASQPCARPRLLAADPRLAFARAAALLKPPRPPAGIHPSARIEPGGALGEDVSIGPGAVLEAGVVVGARTRIDAGAVVGRDVRIGADCHLYPRVVVYPGTVLGDRVLVHAGAVLGADGFGYVRDRASGAYIPFPQQGRLVIEDDVDIGANTTLDRGALEETRIGRGSKLDNLVHVGHNVTIGRNVVIAAQTGVSGSTTIGDGVIVGGQVGIADHVRIGDGAILGAQAGIPSGKQIRGPGVVFWGTPARPIREYLRELAVLARLAKRDGQRRAGGAAAERSEG
jgi:UDP-3-O-[3-hydroxymyristoyl] glucosamine N-acyltransferase